MLVRWAGPHPDEWVPVKGVTADLGEEVRALRAERKRAVQAPPAPRAGERKSPRLAGETVGGH